MSDALYSVRLRWDGRKGTAKCQGIQLRLTKPPALDFSYVEIDYRPPVATIVRSYPWSEPRDMIQDEHASCARYLLSLGDPPDLEADC